MNHPSIIMITLLLVVGVITVPAIVWLFMKNNLAAAVEKVRGEAELKLAILDEKFTAKDNDLTDLKTRYGEIVNQLRIQQDKASELNAAKAGLEQKISQIPLMEGELAKAKEEIKDLERKLADQKATIAELLTLNSQERKHADEKIALLNDAREHLLVEFQNLANKIFEEKSSIFIGQNKTNIDGLLHPLREQINGFRQKVEDVYDKELRDRISLHEEIKHLKDLNQQISKEAVNLSNALKGDSKVQGNWGEIILERVLEQSGLQKGREYEIQASLLSESGRRYQPDVIVKLPEGKDVIIDSKVSLTAYERYCSAETEPEKSEAFKMHLHSIRSHFKALSEKKYQDLEGVRSLDFVLMFIPIEPAFLEAIQQDLGLFSDAFKRNVIITCPSTLLVTLRTIHTIWRYEYQNQNSQEIARRAGDLYDKFVGFIGSLEDIGKQLDKARECYHLAHKRLTSGSGNVVSRIEAIKELGADAKKSLPERLLGET